MNEFEKLRSFLDIKEIDKDIFEGQSYMIGTFNIYGGQVLAQAITAAYKLVSNNKILHSLHSYFLAPGDQNKTIKFLAQVVKKGRSFDTIRITAKQGDRNIFILAASFHIKEEGIQHQVTMPNVLLPEQLEDASEVFERFNKNNLPTFSVFKKDGAISFKPVEIFNPFEPGIQPPTSNFWFKPNTHKIDDATLALKQVITTYVTDFNLLVTALKPHNMSLFTTPMQIASLDHSIWFHNEPDLDDYMLYAVESPIANGARGLCTGKIFTRNGLLVATVIQEGLIRKL